LGSIGVSGVFAFQYLYPSVIGLISNILPAVCATGAFLSVLLCVRRYGYLPKTRFQAAWVCFLVGFALWVAAETIWAAYYFEFNTPIPTYSVADLFYSAGYLPIFAGLLLYLDTFHVALDKKRIGAAAGVILLAVALVMYAVVPTELATGHSFLKVFDDLTFVLLDLVLFSLVVLTFTIFAGGRISKWLLILGGASVLYVFGDEDFLILTANGSYYNGSYNDLIFLLAYITFAFAFYVHRREW
jgi:hypothetical protein